MFRIYVGISCTFFLHISNYISSKLGSWLLLLPSYYSNWSRCMYGEDEEIFVIFFRRVCTTSIVTFASRNILLLSSPLLRVSQSVNPYKVAWYNFIIVLKKIISATLYDCAAWSKMCRWGIFVAAAHYAFSQYIDVGFFLLLLLDSIVYECNNYVKWLIFKNFLVLREKFASH